MAGGANVLRRVLSLAALLPLISGHPLAAQRTTVITLVAAPGGNGYRFEPERVTARPGDVLEFTVGSGGPYVVGFEPAGLEPRTRALLANAMQDRTGELRGPVLLRAGSRFRFTLPALPKGTYRFVALTHIAYRMAGVLTVP